MVAVEERRRVTARLTTLQYVITILFTVLAASFWVLQIVQHAKFQEMAENNNQRTLALRAPRGIVLDRDNHVLVENRRSFSIAMYCRKFSGGVWTHGWAISGTPWNCRTTA